jgi:hypothetical protein
VNEDREKEEIKLQTPAFVEKKFIQAQKRIFDVAPRFDF